MALTSQFTLFVFFASLQLSKSDVLSKQITFTDANQFQDISLYNFYAGEDTTYEFSMTAREGKKVSLYLFQDSQEAQYELDAYDGTDDKAKELPVDLYMQKTDYLMTLPINISSTGRNMFLRVTVDRNSNKQPDFQAMVTDYIPEDECYLPAFSVNVKANCTASYMLHQNKKGSCLYIIHANDPTNQASAAQKILPNIVGLGLDKVNVYKGLQMDEAHLLQTTSHMTSVWAYDSYLIIQPKQELGLNFGWDNDVFWDNTNTMVLMLPVLPGTDNTLMTMDYLREPNPHYVPSLSSKFTLNMIDPATSVAISYLKLGGTGSLTVTPLNNGQPISEPITYYADQFNPFTLTYECEQLQILYVNLDITPGSGFYGTYTGGISTTDSTPATASITQPILANSTNLPTTTTTTTIKPIQTTTKAGNSFGLVPSLVLSFLIMYI